MKCFICGKDMQPGGIVTDGISAMWFPESQLKKKGLTQMVLENGRKIGHRNFLLRQTTLDNAYFCPHCQKIIGLFDLN